MYSREEVKAKIAKLLALSGSDSRALAEAAIAKAHSLMLQYAIEEYEIHAGEKSLFGEKLLLKGKTRSVQHKLICSIIQDYFNVKVISYRIKHKSSVTYVFGTETNCEFAHYVHDFLLSTYSHLWERYKERNYFLALNISHSRSFYYGLSDGFRSTLAKDTNDFVAKAKPSDRKMLMLVDTDLNQSFKKVYLQVRKIVTKFKTDRKKKFVRDIYKRGVYEGKQIKVNRGIEYDVQTSSAQRSA